MKSKTSYILAGAIALGVVGWMLSDNIFGGNSDEAQDQAIAQSTTVEAGDQTGGQTGGSDDAAKSTIVSAVMVENTSIRRVVRANGVSEPEFEITVSARIDGNIVDVPVKDGIEIEKGATLVVFDKGTLPSRIAAAKAEIAAAETNYDASLKQAEGTLDVELAAAKANLEVARQRLEVGEKLAKQNFSAPLEQAQLRANYENARVSLAKIEMAQNFQADISVSQSLARLEAAKSQLSVLQDQLDDSVITAPVSGRLESVHVDVGERLRRDGAAATILGMDNVMLVVAVPQTNIAQVTLGDPVDIIIAGAGERTGIVTKIASKTSSTTRTFDVEITVPNADRSLRAGVSLEASIDVGFVPAFGMSPAHLSVAGDGSLTVKIVVDGKVQTLPVEMVRSGVEQVFVSGLPDGATLLTFGQAFVEAGDNVQIDLGSGDAS